jgi:L-threonylcarbamoyladenylate synthase
VSYFSNSFDERIIELLRAGGAGFMPSDTVYGLSALAQYEAAVSKIYELKGRDNNKPCIILLANVEQARQVGIESDTLKAVQPYWPAALTFIAPAPNAPKYLHRGLKSLAVRVPDNKELLRLLSTVGPLVSTSANLQNEPVAHDIHIAREYFGDRLDFYVDSRTLNGQPSTIAQLNARGELEIIRQGAWQRPL